MLPAPAQLAKKLATGIIPPAVHRRRDLRREAAGFVFQRTRSLAPEKPELPQVRRLEITPVRYQRPARSRRWPERRRDLPSASVVVARRAVSGTVNATRNIGRVHALRSQGNRPR